VAASVDKQRNLLRGESTLHERLMFYAILVASVLSSSVILPRVLGIVLLVGVYGVFLLIAFHRRGYAAAGPAYAFAFVVLLACIMVVNHTRGYFGGLTDLFFPLVTTFLVCANLFVLPHVVDAGYFLYGVNRLSAAVVVVGIPSIILGDLTVLWFTIENWPATREMHLLGWEHNPLRSIYSGSQNNTAVLLFVGVLAGANEFVRNRSYIPAILLMINGIGLYLTHSRGGIAVAVLGFGVLLSYWIAGRWFAGTLALVGGVAFFLGVLTHVGVLPGPSWLNLVNINDRSELWHGGYEAFRRRPGLGYGIVDTADVLKPYIPEDKKGLEMHGAYFRMFLYTGAMGGITYMLFILYSIADNLYFDGVDIAIFAIAVAFAVHHFQGGAPIFGANFKAVGPGLAFGYLLNSNATGRDGDNSLVK